MTDRAVAQSSSPRPISRLSNGVLSMIVYVCSKRSFMKTLCTAPFMPAFIAATASRPEATYSA